MTNVVTYEVSDTVKQAVEDPKRLAFLRKLALLDTPSEVEFDRITRLASEIIGAPISLVSLVDADRQFFKSHVGLSGAVEQDRQTPLSHSFCQHVVATQEPLVVSDAREVDFLKYNGAIPDLNVIGYLGMPLTINNQTLGSFCVIDNHPRVWTEREIRIIHELADTVMDFVKLRTELVELHANAEAQIDDVTAKYDAKIRKVVADLKSGVPAPQILANLTKAS